MAINSGDLLAISAKNLHHVLEQMESWRYYLPDLTAFEKHLKPKPISSESQVDVSKNIAKLEDTNECPHCDFRNADLTGMNLENANLQGANLEGANLEEAKFSDDSIYEEHCQEDEAANK